MRGQVFAWNPSITGVKSEDAVLIRNDGNEVLTSILDWLTVKVSLDRQEIERPTILEIT